jgi:hypothetical protein
MIADVQDVIRSALGGESITRTIEGASATGQRALRA